MNPSQFPRLQKSEHTFCALEEWRMSSCCGWFKGLSIWKDFRERELLISWALLCATDFRGLEKQLPLPCVGLLRDENSPQGWVFFKSIPVAQALSRQCAGLKTTLDITLCWHLAPSAGLMVALKGGPGDSRSLLFDSIMGLS